jgi:hypothetical protein
MTTDFAGHRVKKVFTSGNIVRRKELRRKMRKS